MTREIILGLMCIAIFAANWMMVAGSNAFKGESFGRGIAIYLVVILFLFCNLVILTFGILFIVKGVM